MIELKISDYDIKQMTERAIRDQVRSDFNSSYSTMGKRFQDALGKALTELGPEIDSAVREGVRTTLLSSNFKQALQAELLKACSDKFGGAMNAIMKAAAKRAATDAGFQKDVEKVVVSTMQGQG